MTILFYQGRLMPEALESVVPVFFQLLAPMEQGTIRHAQVQGQSGPVISGSTAPIGLLLPSIPWCTFCALLARHSLFFIRVSLFESTPSTQVSHSQVAVSSRLEDA